MSSTITGAAEGAASGRKAAAAARVRVTFAIVMSVLTAYFVALGVVVAQNAGEAASPRALVAPAVALVALTIVVLMATGKIGRAHV